MSSKKGEKFGIGLLLVAAAVSLSLFSFMTGENSITGFAVALDSSNIESSGLTEFNDADSLSTLSAGNYYIGSNGVVYWVDDGLSPAIAKVNNLDDSQKNRYVYIDPEGDVGYILDPLVIENEE